DETVLTVGPNTDVRIDDMVYDPAAADKSKLAARISSGTFGYISGRIAELHPENVEITVPVGTIGVRGTSIFGLRDPATGKTFIGLLGPGPHNDANLRSGGFTLTNQFGTTEVLRSGFGVFASANEPPGPPTPIPPQFLSVLLNQLRSGVSPRGGAAGPIRDGKNAPDQSGAVMALIGHDAGSINAINLLGTQFSHETANAAQNLQQVVTNSGQSVAPHSTETGGVVVTLVNFFLQGH
ncbi:MAG TPA: hypothetical protein VEU47_18165, partial [Candidatus Cybelea sp.]|nr:hypothetical protein [Candidatus Cybelea sp.]